MLIIQLSVMVVLRSFEATEGSNYMSIIIVFIPHIIIIMFVR